MNEIKIINISPTSVLLKAGEWYHGAEAELYPTPIKPFSIVWSSDKQDVATVNPVNGYVYAHNPGIAIITARLDSDEKVTACYTVFVENNNIIDSSKELSGTTVVADSNTKLAMRRSDCGSYSDMAFGYSGTVYSYTVSGNNATLNKGIVSKTKPYNYYVASFQSALYDMAVIYASFSPLQRQAWLVLRGYGLLTLYSMDALDTILLLAGVDLQGQLESTVLGMNAWYRAEEQAKNYFSLF